MKVAGYFSSSPIRHSRACRELSCSVVLCRDLKSLAARVPPLYTRLLRPLCHSGYNCNVSLTLAVMEGDKWLPESSHRHRCKRNTGSERRSATSTTLSVLSWCHGLQLPLWSQKLAAMSGCATMTPRTNLTLVKLSELPYSERSASLYDLSNAKKSAICAITHKPRPNSTLQPTKIKSALPNYIQKSRTTEPLMRRNYARTLSYRVKSILITTTLFVNRMVH
jgi:hypothetical protein